MIWRDELLFTNDDLILKQRDFKYKGSHCGAITISWALNI